MNGRRLTAKSEILKRNLLLIQTQTLLVKVDSIGRDLVCFTSSSLCLKEIKSKNNFPNVEVLSKTKLFIQIVITDRGKLSKFVAHGTDSSIRANLQRYL